MPLVIVLAVLLWFLAVPVQAQTVLKVPFGSGLFAWDVPAPDATHSLPDKHVIVCGSVTYEVPMPQTSVRIRDVVPGPGTYDCTIYSENAFSRQAEPNVPFPQFQAGNAPPAPVRQRLEVQ